MRIPPLIQDAVSSQGLSFLLSTQRESLLRIAEPQWNLCIWHRAAIQPLSEALRDLASSHAFFLRYEGWKSKLRIEEFLAPISALTPSIRTQWAEDIALLTELFCEAAGSERITMKLGTSDRTDCPVFHTDYVPLRLLCTYAGAGTEYLAEHDVQRASLGQGAGCSAQAANVRIMKEGAVVRRVDAYSVAFCKGATWPGNRGRGLVHRSPERMEGMPPRIKLTIDTIEE